MFRIIFCEEYCCAAEQEKIVDGTVKSRDDDASDDERNIYVQNSLLNNDKSTAYDRRYCQVNMIMLKLMN